MIISFINIGAFNVMFDDMICLHICEKGCKTGTFLELAVIGALCSSTIAEKRIQRDKQFFASYSLLNVNTLLKS